MPVTERLMSAAEAAKKLGISIHTLRGWARARLIPAGRTVGGGRYVFSEAQIEEIRRAMEAGNETSSEDANDDAEV